MGKFRRSMASWPLLTLSCLAFVALLAIGARPIKAGTLVYDAGVRASIYDDNYKLGLGLELGAVKDLNPQWDLGVHVNYTHFGNKTDSWTSATELGGYVTAYFLPKLDQDFKLKLGPHIGYSHIRFHYIDIGGDLVAVFQIMPKAQVYAAFIPAFFIGKNPQPLIRIGLGMHYHPGF